MDATVARGARRRRVALIGDAFVDVQVSGVTDIPAWGTDVACSSVRLLPGGSCGNTARQLASLGLEKNLETFFFSVVGDDEAGRHYVRTLDEERGLTEPRATLHVAEGTPQSCCVVLAGPADRAMCSCYATVHRVTIERFEPMLAERAPWALLHLGGYFNCVGLHTERTLRLIETLRGQGTVITMGPQHDCTGRWAGEGGHVHRLLPLLDVFLPNTNEALGVSGAATAEAALDVLAARYPTLLIVMSRGADGLCVRSARPILRPQEGSPARGHSAPAWR